MDAKEQLKDLIAQFELLDGNATVPIRAAMYLAAAQRLIQDAIEEIRAREER